MNTGDRVPYDAQSVGAPLSRFAVFLVLAVDGSDAGLASARALAGGIGDLVKDVGFRDLGGRLSCVLGIGSALWDRMSPGFRPAELHPFRALQGAVHAAPSTPGDLLLHIRADRQDLPFEFERLLLESLGPGVSVVDETAGFRYFDSRDLLGFVDGTADPDAADIPAAAIVDDADDPGFGGGSYVVVQKYLHDLAGWNALDTGLQERIVGRRKPDNVELDDPPGGRLSHKSLTTIDVDGQELDILRDNMPFGSPAAGEFGTYFIGYSARLWVTERMLTRMFVGAPAGSYDRILDFSTAVTGSVFFAPTRAQLAALADGPLAPPAPAAPPAAAPRPADGSLGIGSLKEP